jgi:ATP-dependent Clp protease ATP-binding subunit ClpB
VQDPLAEMILAGKVKDGETVPVDVGPGGLMIGDVTVAAEKRPAGVALN